MNTKNIKNGQRVTILNSCDYAYRVKGMQGVVVDIKENGAKVHLNVYPTLPYQDNIFFFPYEAIY